MNIQTYSSDASEKRSYRGTLFKLVKPSRWQSLSADRGVENKATVISGSGGSSITGALTVPTLHSNTVHSGCEMSPILPKILTRANLSPETSTSRRGSISAATLTITRNARSVSPHPELRDNLTAGSSVFSRNRRFSASCQRRLSMEAEDKLQDCDNGKISSKFTFAAGKDAHYDLRSPSHSISLSSTRKSPNASEITHDATDFEHIDDMISNNPIFFNLLKLVRICAAQPSCDRMVLAIEQHGLYLVNATALRVFIVQKDGLSHPHYNSLLPLDSGIVNVARLNREIINVVLPTLDPRFSAEVDQFQSRIAPSAMVCVPVEADVKADCSGMTHVIAVIQAIKEVPGGSFSSRDCKVLLRLADLVGNMLFSTRTIDRTQAMYNESLLSHKRSIALLDIAKALASERKLENIVSIIVSQVPELLDSDRCTLFFVDREKEELIVKRGSSKGRTTTLVSWIFGQSNAPELPFPKDQDELRFSVHNGIAGHVALTGEVVNLVDAHLDPRFNSAIDKETGYRTRSILCVPMIDQSGTIIGVVQAINKNPLYPRFYQEDETLLRTFAAQAALAVRNAELLAKTEAALQQSDALLDVTQALSQELNIEALTSIICSKVQSLLNSERCTVFIVDKERRELYTSEQMTFGMGPPLPIDKEKSNFIYFPLNRGIAGSVATTGRTISIPDAYKDPRFNRQMDVETGFKTRSILSVPIVNHRNEIVGVLQVMNRRSSTLQHQHFDEADERMLSAFCASAAVAIENSRLFQETEKALNHALADQRNLKFMLRVVKNLFTDMHLNAMIEQLTTQVHHLLKADDCVLYLVDNEKQEFYLAKDEGKKIMQKHYPFTKGIVGAVASTGQIIRISNDAYKDPRFDKDVDQRINKTTHSVLCCPVLAEYSSENKTVVAVFLVRDEKDRGGFEVEEEKLVKIFCAQAALSIASSRRFSAMLEPSELKESDHSAADYLKRNRGMKIGSNDINSFHFRKEELQILQAIGTGSYGEVYKALVRGHVVAVKELHVKQLKGEQIDAFCNEAALMCQLAHKNIVGFIGAVTEPASLSIITEFCERGSLADLLLNHEVKMPFRMKVKFALDAAMGMEYLHSSNPVILHRDLKSDNLLVTADWTIKVADFGLTRFISEKKQMTQVGTPLWMSPETIMGKKYTEKADVYAFGIILWEILTRLEPYDDKEPMQIVVEVVNNGLRPHIAPEFAHSPLLSLIVQCWDSDPNNRPPFERIVERLKQIAAFSVDDDSEYGASSLATKLVNAKRTIHFERS